MAITTKREPPEPLLMLKANLKGLYHQLSRGADALVIEDLNLVERAFAVLNKDSFVTTIRHSSSELSRIY